MQNYTRFELSNLADIIHKENSKEFSKDALALTSCEISVNTMPAGVKLPSITSKESVRASLFRQRVILWNNGDFLTQNYIRAFPCNIKNNAHKI